VFNDKWDGDGDIGWPVIFAVHTSNMLIWDRMSGWSDPDDTSGWQDFINWFANGSNGILEWITSNGFDQFDPECPFPCEADLIACEGSGGVEAFDFYECEGSDVCCAPSGDTDPCPDYTGDDPCCLNNNPCDWALNDVCDCDSTCAWDAVDCEW
jgi:hypothetical protein